MNIKRIVVIGLILVLSPMQAWADDAQIKALRGELAKLRAGYEQQLNQLEKRIQQLEQPRAVSGPVASSVTNPIADAAAKPAESSTSSEIALSESATATQDPFESTKTETIDVEREKTLQPMVEKIVRGIPAPFEFHGYLRSGFGSNERGGDQEAFQAPTALSKYRLGNETETYLETQFTYNVLPKNNGESIPSMKLQIRPSIKTGNNGTYDSLNDMRSNDIALREAFAQIGNLFESQPKLSFWGGQRFYRREDIHIIDFYWLDMSGYGGGFEDLNTGVGNLAVAYIGGSNDDLNTQRGRLAKQSVDVRLYDVAVPLGSATLWTSYSRNERGRLDDESEYPGSDGAAFGVIHERPELMGGNNKLSLQYGFGSASNFNTFLDPLQPTLNDSRRVRLTEAYTVQPLDELSLQAVLVGEQRDNGGDGESEERWISTGARPVLHLNQYFSLAFEGGVDWVENDKENYSGALYKFAFAPQIAPAPTFFSRPVLRLYATYAKWGDELRNRVGGQTYQGRTDGFAMGTQVEAWW